MKVFTSVKQFSQLLAILTPEDFEAFAEMAEDKGWDWDNKAFMHRRLVEFMGLEED